MWGWIIKVTMISLLLIFLLHYLYSFFKTTLTSPKLKDLVNKPQAKYDTIYNSLKSAGDGGKQNLGEDTTSTSEGNSNSNSNSSSMKDELKKYLKELHVSNNNSGGGGGGSGGSGSGGGGTIEDKNIINPHNEANTSLYSPNSIMTGLGANGISTRVNNTSNYMPNINNNSGSNVQPDYGTPSMSSSYASAYSPY
jgi:hypothetical protein